MIARSQLLLSYYNSLEDLLNIPEILTLEPVLNNHFDKYMPAYTHLRLPVKLFQSSLDPE